MVKVTYTLNVYNIKGDPLFSTILELDHVPKKESQLEKEIMKTLSASFQKSMILYKDFIRVIIPSLYYKPYIYFVDNGTVYKKKYKAPKENKKYKVIFLDKDGVLNGYNYFNIAFHKLIRIIKPINFELFKKLKHEYDIFGFHRSKLKRLQKIVKYTGAKIVLTTAVRNNIDEYNEIKDQLNKYGMEIFDKTPTARDRSIEIFNWLSVHENEVENYIVIDDECMDIFYPYHFVQTSHIKRGEIIKGRTWERTGLQFRHMIKAIRLLNRKEI